MVGRRGRGWAGPEVISAGVNPVRQRGRMEVSTRSRPEGRARGLDTAVAETDFALDSFGSRMSRAGCEHRRYIPQTPYSVPTPQVQDRRHDHSHRPIPCYLMLQHKHPESVLTTSHTCTKADIATPVPDPEVKAGGS